MKLMSREYDPVTDMYTDYWQEGTKLHVQKYQMVANHLRQNQKEYAENSSKARNHRGDGLGQKVASIPMGIAEKLAKNGLNVLTCGEDQLKRLLNNPEYRALRTAPGTV